MTRFVVALVALLVGCEVAGGDEDVRDGAGEVTDVAEVDAQDSASVESVDDVADVQPDIQTDVQTDTVAPRDFGPPVPAALAASLQGVLDQHFVDVKAPRRASRPTLRARSPVLAAASSRARAASRSPRTTWS